MNYKKHYDKLMERSFGRILEGYVEKHHILPKCLGGLDDRENIAILTPEEHFVAHQLLVKIYPNNRDLIYACQLMTCHQSTNRVNNKLFGWLRKQMAINMSTTAKEWYRNNEHPRGFLGGTHSQETRDRIRLATKIAKSLSIGVKVYAYNLDGTFYKEFDTLTDCAVDLKTSPSNVKYTAEGRFLHCKGKQLRYDYSPCIPQYVKPKSKLIGKIRSTEHAINLRKAIQENKDECVHCGFKSSKSAISRYHNDKCKSKL